MVHSHNQHGFVMIPWLLPSPWRNILKPMPCSIRIARKRAWSCKTSEGLRMTATRRWNFWKPWLLYRVWTKKPKHSGGLGWCHGVIRWCWWFFALSCVYQESTEGFWYWCHFGKLSGIAIYRILSEARSFARKTILRLARALQAMQRMSEAMRLLHHERRNYPECQEMQRLAESTRLALRF